MKTRHSIFLYFLFFISTYGRLISNDKITEDFDLVEGISYNIVHWWSDSNLDSKDKVHVSSESDQYQYWTLRKANNGHYNIISTKSGRNLDSNGRGVYVSTPENNSRFNSYQHWAFKKIKNNTYNILHAESRNLDSDSNNVYISTPEHDSKINPYQHWLFEPKKYNLTAVVMNFDYPPDLKDTLDQYKTRTSLFSGDYIIDNKANVTIEHTIDRTEKKLNSYTFEIKKSESIKTTKYFSMSLSISGTIFGVLGVNTGFVGGFKREVGSTYEKIYKESVTEEVEYHSRQKIIVPPFNSVIVNSTVDKISIHVPFKAKIRITGKGDRLDDSGKVISMVGVEVNALRCYLQKEGFDRESITVEGDSVIVDTNGVLKVDGYGLETRLETIEIPLRDHEDHEDPVKSEPSFLPYLLIIIFMYITSQCIKLYLKRRIYDPI